MKAWGLWSELSGDSELTAIQIVSGDRRAMPMEGSGLQDEKAREAA